MMISAAKSEVFSHAKNQTWISHIMGEHLNHYNTELSTSSDGQILM